MLRLTVLLIGFVFNGVHLDEINDERSHFPNFFSKVPFYRRENKTTTECSKYCGSHYDTAWERGGNTMWMERRTTTGKIIQVIILISYFAFPLASKNSIMQLVRKVSFFRAVAKFEAEFCNRKSSFDDWLVAYYIFF